MAWFAALALGLMITNCYLLIRNHQLLRLANLSHQSLEPRRGDVVTTIKGADVKGRQFDLEFGKDPRKTILFIFSPGCHVCDLNWPSWQEVMRTVDPRTTRGVCLNLSRGVTQEYI